MNPTPESGSDNVLEQGRQWITGSPYLKLEVLAPLVRQKRFEKRFQLAPAQDDGLSKSDDIDMRTIAAGCFTKTSRPKDVWSLNGHADIVVTVANISVENRDGTFEGRGRRRRHIYVRVVCDYLFIFFFLYAENHKYTLTAIFYSNLRCPRN